MHFYWVRDRVKQRHFYIFWKPGLRNLGGYFTKHKYPEHNNGMIPVYLNFPNNRHNSERVCYSKCTSKITQGKSMITRGYNNTESQS